jgi:hypothetical protein
LIEEARIAFKARTLEDRGRGYPKFRVWGIA